MGMGMSSKHIALANISESMAPEITKFGVHEIFGPFYKIMPTNFGNIAWKWPEWLELPEKMHIIFILLPDGLK